jgi:UDP-glucose 4-epimerase
MPGTTLITGGAGFIGSHLADHLLSRGSRVLALDDFSTGSRANIAHLTERPDFEFTEGDVRDWNVLGPLLARSDRVYHLAAAVGVRRIVDDTLGSIQRNIDGTESVLELATRRSIPVLVASSSEVYGKSVDIPFTEDGDLVIGSTSHRRWSYACGKAIDEFLALGYVRQRGLPVVIARLFNTVGPRQSGRYGMVLPRFVRQALAGDPITVYGDGEQSRCFCDVGDVVPALVTLFEKPEAVGRVFNIGSQEEVRIIDLAHRVIERLDSPSKIVLIPFEEAFDASFDDIPRRVPNVARLRALTGFEPRISLDEIIDRVAAYIREHRAEM